MNANYIQLLNNWFKNDKNPMKTMDLLASKLKKEKELSKVNPLGFLKQYYPEHYKGWLGEKKRLEGIYAINNGFSKDKEWKHSWCVPSIIHNLDPDYWRMITHGKQYEKYPYFVVSNPYAHKTLDRRV